MNLRHYTSLYTFFLIVLIPQGLLKAAQPAQELAKLTVEEKANYAGMIEKAVNDVINAEPHEISYTLTQITPWNKEMLWSKDKTHILMVSWVPEWAIERFYPKNVGSLYLKNKIWTVQNIVVESTPMGEPSGELQEFGWNIKEPIIKVTSLGAIWASPVKEVFDFVKNYQNILARNQQLNRPSLYSDGSKRPPFWIRMSQLLGLIGDNQTWGESIQKRAFVEFWVRPSDLVRPCIDSEIIDKECTLDQYQGFDMTKLLSLTEGEKEWFKAQKERSFTKDKIPWTRLGYTYDWGNAEDHVKTKTLPHEGMSEFILKPGATIILHRIVKDTLYGKNPTINSKEASGTDLTGLPN